MSDGDPSLASRRRRPRLGPAASFVAFLAAVAAGAWRAQPPTNQDGVDAAYVKRIVQTLAAEPRPVESPANAAAREFLVGELRGLGYDVRLQRDESPDRADSGGIDLANVLATKAGTGNAGHALMLVSHYDSAWSDSRGAGDAASGVAAVMEAARQLAQRPPKNDVVILLTDGEEAGLLGALVWAEQTAPDFMNVKAALNFEGRGVSGPSVLFETGRGNAALIDHWASAAPHPIGTSLAPAVYDLLPNATDFTVFKFEGVDLAGLNFAFVGGYEHYHRAGDNLDNLSRATMLHQAGQAAALAQRLGDADLSDVRSEGDAIFFDVLGLFVVRYPMGMRWPLVILLAMGVAGVAWRLPRARWTAWALAVGIALAWVVAMGAWTHLLAINLRHPQSGAHYAWIFAGAAVAAGLPLALPFFGGEARRRVTFLTTLAVAALAVAAAIWLPGGSYLPTLVGVGGVAMLLFNGRSRPLGWVAAFVVTAMVAEVAWLIGLALTLPLLAVPAVLLTLAAALHCDAGRRPVEP